MDNIKANYKRNDMSMIECCYACPLQRSDAEKSICPIPLKKMIKECGIDKDIPDGNIWMSFSELVALFDVAAPTLRAAIRAIHKSGVIAEHMQHCEVIPYTYWATLYNMDMIAALAFRINSYGAEKIRGELLKRIYGRKEAGE